MSNTFPHVCWPFVCLLLRRICSGLWPILSSGFLFSVLSFLYILVINLLSDNLQIFPLLSRFSLVAPQKLFSRPGRGESSVLASLFLLIRQHLCCAAWDWGEVMWVTHSCPSTFPVHPVMLWSGAETSQMGSLALLQVICFVSVFYSADLSKVYLSPVSLKGVWLTNLNCC